MYPLTVVQVFSSSKIQCSELLNGADNNYPTNLKECFENQIREYPEKGIKSIKVFATTRYYYFIFMALQLSK